MKTTGEAAAALGLKRGKLDSILKRFPSYRPSGQVGHMTVWTDDEIDKAADIVAYVEHGICPHCGKDPDGMKAGDCSEPTDAS